ncbi:2OG-Fe(II) oxygenase [Frateuria aurantia]
MSSQILAPSGLDRPDTEVRQQPFHYLVAHGQLPEAARPALDRDFPAYRSAGFFPYAAEDCGPSIRALVEELSGPAFANAIGQRLGLPELGTFPTLVTLCKSMNRRHGTIHTDSRSKIVTALLYLNPQWPDSSDGCLRFLSAIDDIDAMLGPEIKPLYGELVAFRRSDNSFHGHLPYEGERRVIQVAWLVDRAALERKSRRGHVTQMLKNLFGRLDRRLGAGRSRNASHRD